MVNVGMISTPGITSSTKLNIAPKVAFLPKRIRKMMEETGAQITSNISPIPGAMIAAQPIISRIMQSDKEGCLFIL